MEQVILTVGVVEVEHANRLDAFQDANDGGSGKAR